MNQEAGYRVARARMVSEQLRGAGLADPRVLGAMRDVPRHRFVPKLLRHRAYQPCALPIGSGQTISQPFTVALTCALLELKGDESALEIGTGSGYQAAVLSRLCAQVLTIERVEPLARRAAIVLAELDHANVTVLCADGCEPVSGQGPFDAIVVTACADRFPDTLYRQLRAGGRLVVPLAQTGGGQTLYRFTREPRQPRIERSLDCRFVPLVRGPLARAAAETGED